MLTAEGDSHTYGPANFYRTVSGAREQAEFVSELLLGARLRCANCHNHPLDRWTQDDYHGLAAIFARIENGRVVRVGTRGEVTHPRTGEPAIPRIPGERFLSRNIDGRDALATWVTDPRNPQLTRAAVNRLWKSLMGRGLVEPTDDLRATNPATHPELLDRLSAEFVKHRFDLRHILRLIATSATYARSVDAVEGNRTDDRFYSRALVRPLEAEVVADAISDVTGVWERYGGLPVGTRAIMLHDSRIPSEALDILGRCARTDSCESGPTGAGGISRKLHMINGPLINRKITSKTGRLSRLFEANVENGAFVEEFYVRALARSPEESERTFWERHLSRANTERQRRELLEDMVWSLLSCREFSTNH